jgi:hypothetical protein
MDLTKLDLSSININAYLSTLRECLKSSSQFGADVFYNICTGTHTTVPWGGMDWFMYSGLGVAMTALAVITIGLCAVPVIIFMNEI